MSRLTVFLARFIGLFTVLLMVGFLVRGSAMVETAVADGPVMLVYAIISLAVGLAMILGHNVWSGGALAIVVTLCGWAALIKGLLFLFLPSGVESEYILSLLRNPLLFHVWMTPSLLIGIYLTYGGFTSRTACSWQEGT